MKKIYTIAVLLGFYVSTVAADPTLLWGSDQGFGGGGQVVYTNGLAIASGTGWLVELINTADDSVLYSTTTGFIGDGFFYATPDATAWNGLDVRSIVYDAPDKESAGLFAEFSNGGNLSWSTTPAPPGSFNYNAGQVTATIGSGPGQWQAIPEPTVAAFIGVFGGAMLIARRLFSKSQESA